MHAEGGGGGGGGGEWEREIYKRCLSLIQHRAQI